MTVTPLQTLSSVEYDKTQLGSARRYEWLRHSRTLLMDAYWPPFNPCLEYDAAELADIAGAINADTVRFGTAGKYGLVPSDIMPPHPDLGNRDLLAETIEALKPDGVRLIAYVPVSHGLPRSLLETMRPQWALRLDDGSLPEGIQHFGGELVAPVCPFGQYRADILAFIRNIVENYEVDGLYLDGPYYNWNMNAGTVVCQCDACRESFLAQTGQALLSNRELDRCDNSKREAWMCLFRDWVGQGLLDLLEDIIGIAKREKDLPVLYNAYASGTRPARYERAMIQAADGFLLEAELGALKGLGIGTYQKKIIWRYTQPHTGWPRMSTRHLEEENARSGYETFLWGGAPIVSYAGRFFTNRNHIKPLENALHDIGQIASEMQGCEPVPYVGIVNLQRITEQDILAQKSLEGTYLALQHCGIQSVVIPHEALVDRSELERYAVLLLPSLDSLTEAEANVISSYVRDGGRVLATGSTVNLTTGGTFSELFGIKSQDNVSRQKLRESFCYWEGEWDVYLRLLESAAPSLAYAYSDALLPLLELQPFEAKSNAVVLGHAITGGGDLLCPVIFLNSFGKGTATYVAYPLERVYLQTEEKSLARLIEALIVHTAQTLSPYQLHTHSAQTIRSCMYENASDRFLHLYNPSNTSELTILDIVFRLPSIGSSSFDVRSLLTGESIPFESCKDGVVTIHNYSFHQFDCLAFKKPIS